MKGGQKEGKPPPPSQPLKIIQRFQRLDEILNFGVSIQVSTVQRMKSTADTLTKMQEFVQRSRLVVNLLIPLLSTTLLLHN